MDDRELLAAVAAGDDLALRELFERHAGWIAGRLRRSMPSHAVEDVLQEAFLSAWRGAGSYRGEGDVGGWLWSIARRRSIDWYRREGREPPQIDAPKSQDTAAMAITRADLAAALAEVAGDGERAKLARLALIEERSIREIAAEMDIPVGTVKSRIHRLRQRLQHAIEGNGNDQG